MGVPVAPAEAAKAATAAKTATVCGGSAHRRIACDGSPYTAAEFQEFYGFAWWKAWEGAAHEVRVDVSGRLVDFSDLLDLYGAEDAHQRWNAAVGAHVRKLA